MSTLLEAVPVADTCAIGTLELEHGDALHDVHIAYECVGPADAPAVLVLGGISAGRHLLGSAKTRGWWPGLAGADCVIDPAAFRVISVDWIGGRGASTRPRAGEGWPAFTTRDQADGIAALLDAIGIDRLHAAVGASYGGMVTLALAARRPDLVERAVVICAAHRPHPMTTALRSVQRRIVQHAIAAGDGAEGVGIARALAMTTYRTAAEFDQRFARAATISGRAPRFPVDEYLDHHARDYAGTFPPECFIALSQSLDLHDVDPASVSAPCTLIGFDSDTLVPPSDMRALAAALPDATFTCIPTPYGHDGFLKEAAAVSDAIARAMRDEAAPAAPAGAPPPVGADGLPVTHYAGRVATAERSGTTAAVRAGLVSDNQHGAVIPPIHLSTTFAFENFGTKGAYDYTRSGNPTRDLLASAISRIKLLPESASAQHGDNLVRAIGAGMSKLWH